MAINNNVSEIVRKAIKLVEEHPRSIAVDVDGCLAQYDGWHGVDVIGDPIPEVVNQVKAEKAKGTRIIINTTRTNTEQNKGYTSQQLVNRVKEWLVRHKIPFDEIWAGEGKPIANEYWDDRAVKKP